MSRFSNVYAHTMSYYIFAVHFGGGVVGVIALAFFSKDYGVVYNWNKASGIVSVAFFITHFSNFTSSAVYQVPLLHFHLKHFFFLH